MVARLRDIRPRVATLQGATATHLRQRFSPEQAPRRPVRQPVVNQS